MAECGKIFAAMCGAMADIEAIGKDRKNEKQSFHYRGVDDVYNSLHGILSKNKIFFLATVLEERSEERTSKNGGANIYRILRIKFTFYTDDGSSVESIVIGEGMDSGDKASNKAMSVAAKYALLIAFCIPTEDAKDPDNDSHDIEPKKGFTPAGDSIIGTVEKVSETPCSNGSKRYGIHLDCGDGKKYVFGTFSATLAGQAKGFVGANVGVVYEVKDNKNELKSIVNIQ